MRKITDLAQTVPGLIIRPYSFLARGEGNRIHFNYPQPSLLARGEDNRIHFNYPPPSLLARGEDNRSNNKSKRRKNVFYKNGKRDCVSCAKGIYEHANRRQNGLQQRIYKKIAQKNLQNIRRKTTG